MNGDDLHDDPLGPLAVGEAEDAARLAAALEDGSAAEGEALRAARFLQAVGRAGADDAIAARRLRRRLVARASSRRVFPRAVAAAAAVVLVAVLAGRGGHRAPPNAALLAAREAAAERAVARALSVRGDSLDTGVAVFDALLRERASVTPSSASSVTDPAASPALTPTAGGPT